MAGISGERPQARASRAEGLSASRGATRAPLHKYYSHS